MSADVAGYSRLMADDEAATVATLKEYRASIERVLGRHDGRVVNAPGDNVLAEFPSAVEAVEAAVEIQKAVEGRNVELPVNRRMRLRVGINLGDVIEEADGTIYGDGVNIAARMEALADEGGICISSTVYDAIHGKLHFGFDYLGEQQVKNIERPINVYRVRGEPGDLPPDGETDRRFSGYPAIAAAAAAVALVIGVGAIWHFRSEQVPPPETELTANQAPEPVAVEQPVVEASGPSIAVLPFENLSGSQEEEYFSDGLTDDLITELSRFSDFHVRARNTTAQYKGKAVDVGQVGKDLGVRYVLEGSVRRNDDRIRINVKLIDASTGDNIWTNRYDRNMDDIFAVQDDITAQVIGAIASGAASILRIAESERSSRKHPKDLQAYDLVLQARSKPAWMRDEYSEHKVLLERAMNLDPTYARAHEEYAWLVLLGWIFRFEDSPDPPKELKENAIHALQLNAGDALVRRTAAYGYFFDKQIDLFRRHADRAVEMAPNDAEILVQLGMAYSFLGEWEKGLGLVNRARALNALSAAGWYNSAHFYPLYLQGRYEEANEMMQDHPLQGQAETLMKYVMTYGQLGNKERALEYWQRCLEVEPDWSAQRMIDIFELWNFPQEHIDLFMEGVWKAGVPRPSS